MQEPKIEELDLYLVGIQSVINLANNIPDQLQIAWNKVFNIMSQIANNANTGRRIGYQQFIEPSHRLYFAGIEVSSVWGNPWDHSIGKVVWNIGDVLFACFREKNGEEGSLVHNGSIYEQWLPNSKYRWDNRFLGDFECYSIDWKTIGKEPNSEYHEVWIPVIPQQMFRGKKLFNSFVIKQ